MPQADERLKPFQCSSNECLERSHPSRKNKDAARVGHPDNNRGEHPGNNETGSNGVTESSGGIESKNAAGSNSRAATGKVRRK
jgi:hypothetical protein